MRFIDECTIEVMAGDGGSGCIAFRREKYVPFGGPAGGDGGRGGDVILEGDGGVGTLYDLHTLQLLRAAKGESGRGKDCYGHAGVDCRVRVPLGTVVYDEATREKLGELTSHGQTLVVARGGQGGRGNKHFATPVDRAPRRCEPGEPGEKKSLRLELRSMADVGLLGFPNVGKSTLIRAVSRAHPKVADYPFTTLEPHLGVVVVGEARHGLGRSFVLADIPGIIAGASDGHGLGLRFLRHVQRTRILLHLLSLDASPERDVISDYLALRKELEAFGNDLEQRQELVAVTKADLPEVREAFPAVRSWFEARNIPIFLISAAARTGIDDLMAALSEAIGRSIHPA